MRRFFISGNWKMNKTRDEAALLAGGVAQGTRNLPDIDTAIFPPFPFLETVAGATAGSRVLVGAQNVCSEEKGAYTGEVSAPMLKSIGCTCVIIGHSERRSLFHEDDSLVNAKTRMSLEQGLMPVLCIGETLEQRTSARTFEVLNRQLVYGLQSIDSGHIGSMVIAYEPVWAIGTGMSASGEQACEVHGFIRETIGRFAGGAAAEQVRIIYGGSVKPSNAADLLARDDIDGVLVGGASLDAESFCSIAQAAAGAGKSEKAPEARETGAAVKSPNA